MSHRDGIWDFMTQRVARTHHLRVDSDPDPPGPVPGLAVTVTQGLHLHCLVVVVSGGEWSMVVMGGGGQ